MKLEYLDNISDNGKYPWADPDKLIRLYDFTPMEAGQLITAIEETIISGKGPLDLHSLPFVQPVNCSLQLKIAESDYGIDLPPEGYDFLCRLTRQTYENMVGYMTPFADSENYSGGYNWLYDPGPDKVDFLFSPGGTW